jgi:hypothetical protein
MYLLSRGPLLAEAAVNARNALSKQVYLAARSVVVTHTCNLLSTLSRPLKFSKLALMLSQAQVGSSSGALHLKYSVCGG